MSGAFSGFTDTDIKNVQNRSTVKKPVENGKLVEAKFAAKNKAVKPMVRFDESRNKINCVDEIVLDIPNEAKLSKPEVTVESKPSTQDQTDDKSKPQEQNTDTENENNKLEKKSMDFDELQARQKLIEEQNRMRKELLTRALADKRKRTQEEANRLNEVQNEFKKLDVVLSNDVKLLRKQIEIASIDYMEAQKRYMRIEKAFLNAKFALHKKLEKKELLTEHLCRIIEQNEERKAEKLTELLNKLEIADIHEIEKPHKEEAAEQ